MSEPPDPFAPKRRGVAVAAGLALVGAGLLNLAMGAVAIDPAEVAAVLGRKLGLALGAEPSFQAEAVVWSIRTPRVLLAAVVGAGLAMTGAVLQGLFRNPLADPQLLGIGPGAALGGAIGATAGGALWAVAAGTAAGTITALLLRRLGDRGELEPSRFVLTGVALGSALSAWVGFVVFASDSTRVPPIEFWLLGSLTGSTWRVVGVAAAVVGIGCLLLLAAGRTLDLFALGESEARHLGVNVDAATTVLLITVGAVVGAAVGAVGVVVFVGLLVPHVVRRLTGPSHRPLLVASALAGGALMLLADLVARTVVSPTEIPVGLVTAAVGGPFFLWLMRRPAAGESV